MANQAKPSLGARISRWFRGETEPTVELNLPATAPVSAESDATNLRGTQTPRSPAVPPATSTVDSHATGNAADTPVRAQRATNPSVASTGAASRDTARKEETPTGRDITASAKISHRPAPRRPASKFAAPQTPVAASPAVSGPSAARAAVSGPSAARPAVSGPSAASAAVSSHVVTPPAATITVRAPAVSATLGARTTSAAAPGTAASAKSVSKAPPQSDPQLDLPQIGSVRDGLQRHLNLLGAGGANARGVVRAGVTDQALKQAARSTKRKLPPQLEQFYKLTNGTTSVLGIGAVVTLEDLVAEYQPVIKEVTSYREGLAAIRKFMAEPDLRVQAVPEHDGWFTLMRIAQDLRVVIDTAPGAEGTEGQVVLLWLGEPCVMAQVLAPSLAHYLDALNALLEEGYGHVDPETNAAQYGDAADNGELIEMLARWFGYPLIG